VGHAMRDRSRLLTALLRAGSRRRSAAAARALRPRGIGILRRLALLLLLPAALADEPVPIVLQVLRGATPAVLRQLLCDDRPLWPMHLDQTEQQLFVVT
jgi:hypothetical protein